MGTRRGRRHGASAFTLCAGFALVFAATTLVLRRVLPGDSANDVTEAKLVRFAEDRDAYTVLFLGSSRTYRGFVPSVFDAEMAERGVPTRSFNFGVPGSRVFEVLNVLRRVGELEPPRIDFVFVDPEGLSVLRDERNHLARAVIDWHDPRTTWAISEHIRATASSTEEQLDLLERHWTSCAFNVANVGRALRWTDTALGLGPDDERLDELLGRARDGYAPRGEEGAELGRRGQHFKGRDRQAYLEQLAGFRTLALADGPPAEFALRSFRSIVERVEALGATPIFITQPALYLEDDLIKAGERGDVRTLLRFDSAERFPELYEPDHRYDANHLNDAGARLFTESVAREFAARLERGELRAR